VGAGEVKVGATVAVGGGAGVAVGTGVGVGATIEIGGGVAVEAQPLSHNPITSHIHFVKRIALPPPPPPPARLATSPPTSGRYHAYAGNRGCRPHIFHYWRRLALRHKLHSACRTALHAGATAGTRRLVDLGSFAV